MSSRPIACTLSGDDMARRLNAIADLNDKALRSKRHAGSVLELVYDGAAAVEVRAFVQAERICCAFLTFAVEEVGEIIRVRITAPEDAIAARLLEEFAVNPRSACACT